jgi:acetyl esterase/lipase
MKTNKLFYLFITFFIATLFSCNSDSVTEQMYDTSTEKSLYNVSYGSNNQQVFDLYLPANRTTNTKTLLLVHGGGWTEGDKADMNYVINIIKQYLPGYAIANINYRLASTGNPAFPMQIDDLAAVVSKLKNTDEYVISDNFGFIGVSAGGHLSMLYSYAYNTNNNVKMVCSIVGPTDFTDVNYTSNPFMVQLFQTATGIDYTTNPSFYQQISPLSRATSNSPPTILFYGNQDPLIPTTQGVNLHARLDQLGVYNEFNLYNGGHGDWSLPDQLDAYGKMVTFVQNKF